MLQLSFPGIQGPPHINKMSTTKDFGSQEGFAYSYVEWRKAMLNLRGGVNTNKLMNYKSCLYYRRETTGK